LQIRQRVDSELKRARMAGDQRGGQRFSLDQDLPALLDTLRRLYQDSDIRLQLHEQTGPLLPLEREDGIELLGNLLDNAWKWADTAIQLRISSENGKLTISIEDDGPGIEAQQAEQLLQRGKRRDESVTGYGIGLSIVRHIVDSYHGSMHLQPSEQLGGLQVIVQLPFSPTQGV
jgi:signal transduction histidine kinase